MAGTAHRREEGLADTLTHRRVGDGGAPVGPAARRRGNHALLHLRVHANAFVLRGATPVFVDIRADTLYIDEALVDAAITSPTKAICVMHYAGVGCEMDVIMTIAEQYGLAVIEDAAQGILSTCEDRPLGGIGHLAALSFHATKNVISGEGGALLVDDQRLIARAEIIREKGTNRSKFFRVEVNKYTWVDTGVSHLPSEILAAFLAAQLERADDITARCLAIWNTYHEAFAALEAQGNLGRAIVPAHCVHNAHMYYVLLPMSKRAPPPCITSSKTKSTPYSITSRCTRHQQVLNMGVLPG